MLLATGLLCEMCCACLMSSTRFIHSKGRNKGKKKKHWKKLHNSQLRASFTRIFKPKIEFPEHYATAAEQSRWACEHNNGKPIWWCFFSIGSCSPFTPWIHFYLVCWCVAVATAAVNNYNSFVFSAIISRIPISMSLSLSFASQPVFVPPNLIVRTTKKGVIKTYHGPFIHLHWQRRKIARRTSARARKKPTNIVGEAVRTTATIAMALLAVVVCQRTALTLVETTFDTN